MIQTKIVPNIWYDAQAEQAAEFYCSVFPNSRITRVQRYTEVGPGEPGTVVTVEWELDGQRFIGINGGPYFTLSEAVSFGIVCEDQAEVDYYWDALIAGGGEESQCGWLKDKFGLSWQVLPKELDELFSDPDSARVNRAMTAMLGMRKLDIAAMKEAADGVAVG